MRRALPILLVLFALAVFFVPAGDVFAQTFTGSIVPCGNPGQNPCQMCYLVELAQRIINFFVYASVVIATLAFSWAGILYVTSGAKPGNIETAHKIFWTVLWGFIIVLSAWLIVDTIMKTFFDEQKFGPWNRVECASYGPASGFRPSSNPELGGSSGRANQLEAIPPPANQNDPYQLYPQEGTI